MTAGEPRALFAGKWLFAAIVPLSALVLGSLWTPVLMVFAALAAIACALLWMHPRDDEPPRTRLLLAAMVVLVLFTAFQALPLPAAFVRVVAPASADVWERVLVPFREPAPSWFSISVAPAATRVEVLRGIFYLCMLLGAVRIAAIEDGTRFLERLVVFSGATMAIVTLAHAAFGADRVFGIYRPREAYAYEVGRYGPLLNTNHVAAYLDGATCVALAVSLSRRPAMPRPLAIASVILTAATAVWVGSRGGTGALLFGIVLTAALVAYSRRRFASTGVAAAVVMLGIVVSAALVGFASSESARVDLAGHDVSKLMIARDALTLVPRAPLFGFGRGAFETVFPTVAHATTYVTFTHPEDLVAQWAVEWGPIVALVAAILGFAALRPTAMLVAPRPAVGAWAAIAGCLVHEVVDYHLEVPGIVALFCVIAALVVASRNNAPRSSRAPERKMLRRAAFAAAGATVLVLVWTLPDASHMLAADRADLGAAAGDRTVSTESFRAELHAAMLRYPAEPFFPLLGAVRADLARNESVVPWISAALERNGRFGRAHLVLARSLRARHAAQARLEYRLAYEFDERLRPAVLKEGAALVGDVDEAMELVPDGAAGIPVLDSLAVSLAKRLPSTSAELDAELLRRAPDSEGALSRRVRAILADVDAGAAWCDDRRVCTAEALGVARKLAEARPAECDAQLLVARVQIAGGHTVEALDGLEKALDQVVPRAPCQRELVRLAMENGQRVRADAALDRLVRGGCGTPAECGELYQWAATVQENRGDLAPAIALYQRAIDAAPERDDMLEHLAGLYERTGMLAQAADAYGKLAQRHPTDERWPAKTTALRDKARARATLAHPP